MKNSIIRYRKLIITFLLIVLTGVVASATAPWTVNPSDYRYDMSLYLDIKFPDGKMDYSKYDVAVFSGDQCRGVAEVLSLGDGRECLYIRARSNQEAGEIMTFKYYNKTTEEIQPIDGVSFQFESNARLGYPSDPYVIEIIQYFDVNLNAGEGGSINPEGGRILEGTELVITAIPTEGYHFNKWSDDVTENPRTIVVTGNITLEALFSVNTYKLTYILDEVIYKEYDIDFGTEITPEILPEKEGYTFSGWDNLPTTMPAHDVTVSGTFNISSYQAVFRIDDEVIETKTIDFGAPVTVPEAPVKEGYTFDGWQEVPETMPAHDIEITGSYTINTYTAVFILDGEVFETMTLEYGTAVVAPEAPVKEGYTFDGWQDVPETMPAHDIEITGSYTINTYTAVFILDGEVFETMTLEYGDAVVTPEVPQKEGYTFSGWQGVPETMPDHDIEITGSYIPDTAKLYKLTYLLDGEVYKEMEVEVGAVIVPEAAPTKEGYTFSGWTGLPETMPDHDVTAEGTFSLNSYLAVFRIGEEVIETKTIDFGAPVTVPEAPVKEGYTFSGWQGVPETMPAHDIEITGSYTINTYTAVFRLDGEVFETMTLEYGAAVVAPEVPQKEGYTFSGWQGVPETMPAHDIEITGSYIPDTANFHKLTYLLDGEVYKVVEIEVGAVIVPEAAPTKEGYTFSGWTGLPETMPDHDVTAEGTFSLNSYLAVFRIGEEVIETKTIDFGAPVTVPEAPVKEGYTFSGWQGVPETMPAHDIEITGSYTINTYTAVFRLDSEVFKTMTLEYGAAVVTPEVPQKEGYTFSGWQGVPETMPAHDIEITGTYILDTAKLYKLTYLLDGEVYKVVEIEVGAVIVPETAPTKEGYTFSGWTGLPETMPDHDVTAEGTFSLNSYLAVFRIGEEVIETKTIDFGAPVTVPEAPVKEGYTFEGWQGVPETMPAHDIEIFGSYTVNSYRLTYILDGEVYKEMEVEFGTVIVPEVPEKEGYFFEGWKGLPKTMPAHDVTVEGLCTRNSYNAFFRIGEEFIDCRCIFYGEPIRTPKAPLKEGYTFSGWENVPETMPAHDIEIFGSYTVNSYRLTYILDGEIYSEEDIEFGTVIVPELSPTEEGYTFSGWLGLPETMPAHDLTVNGSFSVNSYCLSLYLNDVLYHSEILDFGTPIIVTDPVVPEGMKFDGWDDEIPETMPAHDVEIYGHYSILTSVDMIVIEDSAKVSVSYL